MDFPAEGKSAYNHLAYERTWRFLEELHVDLEAAGPLNSITINKRAADARVSQASLANQRKRWVDAGELVHDDYTAIAEAEGFPTTLAHFWRLGNQTALTDAEALDCIRLVKSGW